MMREVRKNWRWRGATWIGCLAHGTLLPIGTTSHCTAFNCLEAAVEAAAAHVGMRTSKKHWEKADVGEELHKKYGLPDVAQLLHDLNDARKSAAYGDVPAPDLKAEDVASEIERYVEAVAGLVEKSADDGA